MVEEKPWICKGYPEKLKGVPEETEKKGPVLLSWEGPAVHQMTSDEPVSCLLRT